MASGAKLVLTVAGMAGSALLFDRRVENQFKPDKARLSRTELHDIKGDAVSESPV
jgi:hypothetical protein